MTEFTLASAEFYTPNTDSFAHLKWLCTVLVRWPILRILLYLPYALYAPDDEHFTNPIKTGLSVR